MKKQVSLLFLIVLLVLFSVGCSEKKESASKKEKTTKMTEEKSEKQEYSFYKEENKERYEAYQKQNTALSWKDVILRVNIGLDSPYYENTIASPYLNTTKLLVNKYYYLKEDYVPDNLVELTTTYSKGGISLVKEVALAFQELVDKAKADGYQIRAMSAYRSYQYQVNLYNRYVRQDGQEAADTYSARPGFSEHQTGLCVDVDDRVKSFTDFENTESFKWMQENAYLYGFVLRFPKGKENITGYDYESWHYRYVGKEIAKYIKEHDITFDEYYMEFLDTK